MPPCGLVRQGPPLPWPETSGVGATTPLLALKELRATVAEAPSRPGVVRVRLEGSLVFPWRLLSGRAQAFSVIGVGGGVLLALTVGSQSVPDWHFDVSGALGAVAGAGVGLRSYRRAAVSAEAALDAFLDRLALGVSASAPALPVP